MSYRLWAVRKASGGGSCKRIAILVVRGGSAQLASIDGYTRIITEAEEEKGLSESPFKRDSLEMNFKKVPKIKTTSYDAYCFSTIFGCLFMKKIKK
jgi:hypothetical protein